MGTQAISLQTTYWFFIRYENVLETEKVLFPLQVTCEHIVTVMILR